MKTTLESVSGFSVRITRKPTDFIMFYFTPCFLMVLASWISFVVNYEAVPGRLGLLLTLLLMIINMNNTISESIPKSEKICPLIIWLFMSILFVIFALIEYFIILFQVKFGGNNDVSVNLRKKEKIKTTTQWARDMDRTALVLFPLAYVACVLAYFIWLFDELKN